MNGFCLLIVTDFLIGLFVVLNDLDGLGRLTLDMLKFFSFFLENIEIHLHSL